MPHQVLGRRVSHALPRRQAAGLTAGLARRPARDTFAGIGEGVDSQAPARAVQCRMTTPDGTPDRPDATAPAMHRQLLGEIAAGLTTGDGELGPLLQRFLEPIMRLAGAQAGAVRVLSVAGDRLELVSGIGLPPELSAPGASADRHCGHCGRAADGQALVWASDLHACAERSGSSYFKDKGRGLLAVPLQHRGRVLGVYNLFFGAGQAPSPEVQQILKSVGELLGLALNNARLERENLRNSLMQERQAMAAEVHDAIAQSLTFVKMRLPLLQDAVRQGDPSRAEAYVEDLRGGISQAHASVRAIISELRAPIDPRGLLHALDASAEQFRRSTGTELDLVNELPGLAMAPEQETQVFRIVQEALHNVARHAGAQHARLHIGAAEPGMVRIVVEDDGSGLGADTAVAGHHGLQIMAERARRIGASLEVGGRPGGGTRVALQVPLGAPGTAQRSARAQPQPR